jgi:hypothetical protein
MEAVGKKPKTTLLEPLLCTGSLIFDLGSLIPKYVETTELSQDLRSELKSSPNSCNNQQDVKM